MKPIAIEHFGNEGLEDSLEKNYKEYLEKLDLFNKQFKTSLAPVEEVYGISEMIKPDGILEKVYKDKDGLYNKLYFNGDKLIKSRQQMEKGKWKLLLYDNEGNDYLEKIYSKGEKGLTKTSERLLPNKVIHKDNFVSITDSQGRVISAKVFDLSINNNGRGSLNIDKNGKGYLFNDHRSHLMPEIFFGKGTLENIVPQLDLINQGRIKQVENIARRLKEEGNIVDYEVKVKYGDVNNSKRPTSFEPKITVNGKPYDLEGEYKKIYNKADLSNFEKFKIKAYENVNSVLNESSNDLVSGKDVGLFSGALTFSTSLAEDLKLVISGEMQVEDMVIDVVKDTSIAGGLGYLEGFSERAICVAMRKSGVETLSRLTKTGIPGVAIDFGIKSYESFVNYIDGHIDEIELAFSLGENLTSSVGAFEGAKVGALLGSGFGFVGSAAGGIVGGMVGYCISSELYTAAVEAGAKGVEVILDKARECGKLCIETTNEYMPDFIEEVTNSLNDYSNKFNIPIRF